MKDGSHATAAEPGWLILTADRDDRRVLFDALDGSDVVLHTARDTEQARGFLDQGIDFGLVIAEFVGPADQTVALCAALQKADRSVPILGIVGGAESNHCGYFNTPPGVLEWLRSPVLAAEALFRVRQVLDRQASAPPAQADAYRFAFDASVDEIVVTDLDSGRILDANNAFVRGSELELPQLIGRPLGNLDVSHTREQRRVYDEKLAAEGRVCYRFRKQRADGSSYPVQMHARVMRRAGAMVQIGVIRDIGALVEAKGAFATLSAILAQAGSNNGMQHAAQMLVERMGVDLAAVARAHHDEDLRVEMLAAAHAEGSRAGMDLGAQPVVRLIAEGKPIVHLGNADRLGVVDAFVRDNGYHSLIGLPLLNARHDVMGAFLVASTDDLSRHVGGLDVWRVAAARFGFELELQESLEQGRARGLQDALTGLPNRLLFNDRLQNVLRGAARTGEMFAVVFVDLDRFKTINDSLGHDVGDQVLKAVARRLEGSVRASDTVARYAGDEFTLILRHIVQRTDAMRVAEKIVRIMEEPLHLEGDLEMKITVSVGVSFCPDDADTADELLKHADVAMYSAKGQGRNNVQAYEAVPEESHKQRVALEAKLRVAEANDELRVYYQPQIDARTEDIVGMEALVRWEHPELGMISPGFFIPIAEETGLITSIGEWVLRTACRQTRAWQQRFRLPLRIGVNLSAVQLRQRDLVARVARVLEETRLPASMLELEVTESMDVRGIAGLPETLASLRELGCSIAIDDFGTGQASLDYIRSFPADRVKIDQSFVRNIGVDPDDEAIVRATISMAHSLHHSVVAEGVEIEQHFDFLRAHGCEELQGYLFCRPLAPRSFENMLVERERRYANTRPVLQSV